MIAVYFVVLALVLLTVFLPQLIRYGKRFYRNAVAAPVAKWYAEVVIALHS